MRMRSWWWVVAAGSVLGCGAGPEAVDPGPLRDGTEVQARMEAAWGTREVKQVLPSGRTPGTRLDKEPRPELLTDVAGTLYFVVQEEDQRIALWKSDGTDAGTVVVKAFPPTNAILGGLRIGQMTPLGSRLFFHLFEPALGWELWVSDGTTEGTRPVVDLNPGPEGSNQFNITELNGALSFFRHAPYDQGGTTQLWRSDGTAAGTVQLLDFGRLTGGPGVVLPASGIRVFFTDDFEETVRLWRTDGTAAGTVQLKNFGIPGRYQGTIPWTLRLGESMLFTLQDTVGGTGLWRTDGTPEGTRLLKRLDASADVALFPPQVVDGTVVFPLTDEGPSLEVWKTDGTEAGTLRLDAFGRDGQLLGVAGGFATVLTRTEDGHSKLWRLPMAGGPKEGVTILSNPYADDTKAVPGLRNAVTVGGRIYFARTLGATVQTPRDVDLWVTDGTAAGTRRLASGLTRPDVFHSPLMALDSGRLLFSAKGNVWITDGTVQGTHAVDSLTANKTPAEAAAFTRVGEHIFFRALPGAPGFSLWAVPLSQ
ncbi:hypothetical protein D7V80_38050 [Corallococcus sp. CA054B]|uniref:hypothetical protein n=1 Tax=Corallococcus sp. CA054B TaxID=2316734 RepID=UPI000EA31881|nr:hypothetical protein [Corallococcus sp. CA054B]RKG58514.1 hypothetical protein D7V80_38050 [Corallococcus sp. CA054B]